MLNPDTIEYQEDTEMDIHSKTFENDQSSKNVGSNDPFRNKSTNTTLFENSIGGEPKMNKNKSNFHLKHSNVPQTFEINIEEEVKPADIYNNSISDFLKNSPCHESLKPIKDSRLKLLKEEITALLKQCVEKEDAVKSLGKRLKDLEQRHSELKKETSLTERKYEKLLITSDEAKRKYEAILTKLTDAKSEIADLKSTKRENHATKSELERRLNQALSQTEKLKTELEKLDQITKSTQEKSEKQHGDAKSESTLLSKQKTELFVVVTKQMKLINNLRRQILHLKAGVLEKFTENEIKKAIECHAGN